MTDDVKTDTDRLEDEGGAVVEDTVLTDDVIKDDDKSENTLLSDDKTDVKDGDTKDEDSDADKSEGAPETYEDFKVPEGMEIDTDLLSEASVVFKDLNLDQVSAQKLIDLQADSVQKQAIAQAEHWENTVSEWKETAKNDKEYGRSFFDESLVTAKEAINTFGNDAFKQMLNTTGVGNHPEMVRFLFNVGKLIKDHDILPSGSKDAASKKGAAELIYTASEMN